MSLTGHLEVDSSEYGNFFLTAVFSCHENVARSGQTDEPQLRKVCSDKKREKQILKFDLKVQPGDTSTYFSFTNSSVVSSTYLSFSPG